MAWTILQRQDMAVRAKYHHTVRRDAVIERYDGSPHAPIFLSGPLPATTVSLYSHKPGHTVLEPPHERRAR